MRINDRVSSGNYAPSSANNNGDFVKRKIVLTQDDLIYFEDKNDSRLVLTEENLSCIPLLCIENIYVQDLKKDKKMNYLFYINTASETYTMKCINDLDWNTWIKNLIHCTNLAKESFLIKDLNKRIEQNETLLFEVSTKNSICETKVFNDRKQLDRAFEIFAKYPNRFFTKLENPHEVVPCLKNFTLTYMECKRIKADFSASEQFEAKVKECSELLPKPTMEQLQATGLVNSTFSEDEFTEEVKEVLTTDDNMNKLSKIVDDLFYNLQRLSLSNNIFLEEYYTKLENHNLQQFQKIII